MQRLIAIFCLCAAFLTQAASAKDSVRLVSYTDYAPYISDEVPEGGMLTEVVRAAFAHEATRLEITFMPWKRGYRMVLEGEAIGTFSWQKTAERERDFILSDALFADSNLIFTTLPDFNELADLSKRYARGEQANICIPLGWTIPSRFAPLVAKGVVARVAPEKVGSCLDLMFAGRVHILNVPPLTVYFELTKLAEKKRIAGPVLPSIRAINPDASPLATTHILFARTDAGTAAALKFKKGFAAILKNGTYRAIIERHLALYPELDNAPIFEDLKHIGLLPTAP